MDAAERSHIQQLIEINRAHLRQLELQAAKWGNLNVPTYIALQIESYQREIAELEHELSEGVVPTQPVSSQVFSGGQQEQSFQIAVEIPEQALERLQSLSPADIAALASVNIRTITSERLGTVEIRTSRNESSVANQRTAESPTSSTIVHSGDRQVVLGFQHDPFAFREAEKMPPQILEETFVEHPNFDRYIMDINRSAVLLAPRGGGKTAGRLRLEVSLNQPQQPSFQSLPLEETPVRRSLIATYDNFARIVSDLPNISLSNHFEPLLNAVAEAAFTAITNLPDQFLSLHSSARDWWWAFWEEYLTGIPLQSRLRNDILRKDLFRLASRATPFHGSSSLPDALEGLQNQLVDLGYDDLFILVDGVDGFVETQESPLLDALVLPLLNTLPLLSLTHVVWKFFLPDRVEEVVYSSAGYLTGRLETVSLSWDKESLSELLRRRLEWASEGQIQDIAQLCDQELLKTVDIGQELVDMALQHKRLGPPRALLDLGSQLLSGRAAKEKQAGLLSVEDWKKFVGA